MKKHSSSVVCLVTILIVICSTCVVYVHAENGGVLYQYLDIPFDTATPELVDQIVLEKTGSLEKNEYGNYLISDFGYDFGMQVDFNEDYKSANRVFLGIIEDCWGRGDEFKALVERDIQEFIDIETQLIERYGEPDYQYFYTDGQVYDLPGLTKFMFTDGEWDTDQMMEICEKDKLLVAFSVWGNAELRLWVNWIRECKPGYLVKLDLYFEDQIYTSSPSIVEYPPVVDN